MTLEQFNRDIVPILQLLFTFVALISLVLVWVQIKEATKWNKLNTLISITDLDRIQRLDRGVNAAFRRLQIETARGARSLTDDETKLVVADDDAFYACKELLSDLELLATGINVGAIDYDYAYDLHSSRLFRGFRLLSPVILSMRATHNDDNIFIEFEKLVLEWQEKAEKEASKVKHAANSQLKRRGAKRKV